MKGVDRLNMVVWRKDVHWLSQEETLDDELDIIDYDTYLRASVLEAGS